MIDPQITKNIRQAIRNGDLAKVKDLIGNDAEILKMSTPFGTWLHVASSMGKLDIVKYLVKLGADVNVRGGISGGNALNEAASNGHIDVARYLLQHGADLDVTASERNPLFSAVYGGHLEMAKLLIDAGIDPSIKYSGKSMKEMDAIGFAHERGQSKIEEMLRSRLKA